MKRALIVTLIILLTWVAYSQSGDKPKVLAQVGETKITEEDINEFLQEIPSVYRSQFQTPEGKRALLNKLIQIELFSQEARRLKLDKKPEIKRTIDLLTKRVLEMAYVDYLKTKVGKIKEDELRAYYEKHKKEFMVPERIKARHILVKTKEEAEAIKKRLKSGKSFAQLAKEVSICPSGKRGGELGWIEAGNMVPEFEKVALSLKKGEISDVVHTRFGYHIIQVEDKVKACQKSFAEAKKEIEKRLRQIKEREMIGTTRKRLEKGGKVVIFGN